MKKLSRFYSFFTCFILFNAVASHTMAEQSIGQQLQQTQADYSAIKAAAKDSEAVLFMSNFMDLFVEKPQVLMDIWRESTTPMTQIYINSLNYVYVPRQEFEDNYAAFILALSAHFAKASNTSYSVDDHIVAVSNFLMISQYGKAMIAIEELPLLEKKIKRLNEDRLQSSAASTEEFGAVLGQLTSGQHVAALDFNTVFDRVNSESAENDRSATSCPPTNPGPPSTSHTLYPVEGSKRVKITCVYFSGNELIEAELPYLDNKYHGTVLKWAYSSRHSTHYLMYRKSFEYGKKHGLHDAYGISDSGAVYHRSMKSYKQGVAHGDFAYWYDNGQLSESSNLFDGRYTEVRKFRRDGSLLSCSRRGNDGKNHSCM